MRREEEERGIDIATIPTLMMEARKPGKPGLSGPTLAKRADVSPETIRAMVKRLPVSTYAVTKVLVVINHDYHQQYRLADIDIVIEGGAPGKSDEKQRAARGVACLDGRAKTASW